MGLTYQYSPNDIAQSWGGIDIVSPMDGTFTEVEMSEDAVELFTGAQGDGAFVINSNTSGLIRVTLQQGSISNDFLSAKYREDRLFRTGVHPYIIKDLLGTTLVTAAFARLQRIPNMAFGDTIQPRVWTFICPQLLVHVGSSVVQF